MSAGVPTKTPTECQSSKWHNVKAAWWPKPYSNAKDGGLLVPARRGCGSVYHSLSAKHLQEYPGEYVSGTPKRRSADGLYDAISGVFAGRLTLSRALSKSLRANSGEVVLAVVGSFTYNGTRLFSSPPTSSKKACSPPLSIRSPPIPTIWLKYTRLPPREGCGTTNPGKSSLTVTFAFASTKAIRTSFCAPNSAGPASQVMARNICCSVVGNAAASTSDKTPMMFSLPSFVTFA